MKKVSTKEFIELSLPERIFISSLLPAIGKEETLLVSRDLKNKVLITQKEIESFEIKTKGDNINWNAKGVKSKLKVELTTLEKMLFKRLLSECNSKEQIPESMLDFYLKHK